MTPNQIIGEATKARESAQERMKATQADPRLSDAAKRGDIAEIRAEVVRNLGRLSADHENAVAVETDRLRRRIASPSTTAMGAERVALDTSFRDALERANGVDITSRDGLMPLFDQARLVGDTLQQRAAMVVALDRGDNDVVNAWIAENPAAGADVVAFHEHTTEHGSLQRNMLRAATFSNIV